MRSAATVLTGQVGRFTRLPCKSLERTSRREQATRDNPHERQCSSHVSYTLRALLDDCEPCSTAPMLCQRFEALGKQESLRALYTDRLAHAENVQTSNTN